MDFDGTPIMYSWPSQGSLSAYTVDEGVIDVSVIRMAQFLDAIVDQFGAEHIHLIAHSMGNRVLIGALQAVPASARVAPTTHVFGQIVFTAPDVDRDYFIAATGSLSPHCRTPNLVRFGQRLCAAACRRSCTARRAPDLPAPRSSGWRASTRSICRACLPTCSVTATIAANGGAVYDLLHLLWRGDDPGSPQRCSRNDTAFQGPIVVWRFDSEKCKGDDLLEAAILLKQLQNQGQQQIVEQISAQISALNDPLQRRAGQLILARVNQLLTAIAPPGGVAK
jgi:pimeloyl-ACP methyl ester carboxylesterase